MASSNKTHHNVQVRAYHLWEEAGRPHGRDAEFWERAMELDRLEAAAGQDAGVPPPEASEIKAPATSAKKPRAKAETAQAAPKQPAKAAAASKGSPRQPAASTAKDSAPKAAPSRSNRPRPHEHA